MKRQFERGDLVCVIGVPPIIGAIASLNPDGTYDILTQGIASDLAHYMHDVPNPNAIKSVPRTRLVHPDSPFTHPNEGSAL